MRNISCLHASPSECVDRQETQVLWLCAIIGTPRAVCSQTSTCLSVLILATLSNSCQKADIQELKPVHYLHRAETTWSTAWLVFVLPNLPTFTSSKEQKSNTKDYLLTFLKLTVSVFLSQSASLEDTGPSTFGRASRHFLYTHWTVDISGASVLLQHHLLHLRSTTENSC